MNTVLITTAAILGFLAFFEPCTIATHTLFAARIHHDFPKQRLLALGQLMFARAGLLALIFATAAIIGLTAVSTVTATLSLGIIGFIYMINRKIYIPVPHLEFFRLLPRHHDLTPGLKLGLTLPACTLPLVLIVGVLSALTRQPAIATLAGFIFATMFTLPILWGIAHGLGSTERVFLGIAASLSPYITTAMLWGTALLFWQTGI